MLRRAAALQSRDEERENGKGKGSRDQLLATLRAKGIIKGE
jgi:hypothetical protein